jgi:hypothetical protein
VDLDHPAAVELAPHYLPPTAAIFGRPGKPRSHYLFCVVGPCKTLKEKAADKAMICELRWNDLQTVFPPSVHPSGERIEWDGEQGESATIGGEPLARAVRALADAVRVKLGERLAVDPKHTDRRSINRAPVESTLQRILSSLDGVKTEENRKWRATCPVCRDANPSLSIAIGDNGTILLHCHAGCSLDELCMAVGATSQELFPDAGPQQFRGAKGAERTRPTHPAAAVEPFRPFPVNALPEPLRGFVAVGAKAIGCDSSYVALPLLTAVAASIGNTRRIQLKRGWAAPPILWVAIVGESGTAKTPAFKLAMRSMQERQQRALERHAEALKDYETEVARYEKALAEWRRDKNTTDDPSEKPEAPQAERCIVSDTTVEALAPLLFANPRGLLLSRDELAGWIGSFDRYAGGQGGADAAHWLSMHNGESLIVDRKTGNPRTIFVPQAAVCVCGGIQPAILHRALGVEHRESGLAARILLTCPPRMAKRWTEADIDPAAEAEIARLLDRLYELQPVAGDDGETRPVFVGLSPEAKAEWMAYYNAHAQEQADLAGELSAAWSKLEEYAARLALVVHCVRWASGDPTLMNASVVDGASMAAGIALTTWFKGEARRVYAMLGESNDDRDRRRLCEWIERKGGSATAREVQMGCRWLRESGAAEAALEDLAKSGWGHWTPTPAGQRGQPTRRFHLTTPSTVNGIARTPWKSGNTVDVDNVDAPDTQAADEWGEL